jgi:hypothetical protein
MARSASAFCGFYVAGSSDQLLNDATQVVLMRSGTRTVLSMQNNYKGPPEAFAMVVPVPVVLREQDVKTLTKDVFQRVEQMGAPRLVEYWETDPCEPEYTQESQKSLANPRLAVDPKDSEKDSDLGVKVEAKFTVGEYQVVILSAKDSTGLDTWLRREKYNIPAGAEPLLRPYVEGNMKFFVAKVDPAKVTFQGDRAVLSPLRFHYDADEFALPIRLGLANSGGTQDLIVNIIAPNQRYEVANYKNVTIPTNIDVKPSVKDNFPAFYAALFDATLETNKGAIVTEYAWAASSCDPCPGPVLGRADFLTLGADVLAGTREKPQAYAAEDFVLTRLHARYGKDLKDDLVFKVAPPILGGREILQANGALEKGAAPAERNNFQGRYAIRHPWTGPITCNDPHRGRWGGPPRDVRAQPGFQGDGAKAALDLAAAPRGSVQLASVVTRDVPEIGLSLAPAPVEPPVVGINAGSGSAAPQPQKKGARCGCETSSPGGVLWPGLLALAGIMRRRLRRR